MKPDVLPPVGQWFNIYELSGVTVGKPMLIQQKSYGKLTIWEGASPPAGRIEEIADGVMLTRQGDAAKTTPGIAGCWGYCFETAFRKVGRISVQEYTS